jgi:hypothetical protein
MLTKFLKVLISILAFPCGFILATSAADGQITVDPLPRIAVLTATTNAPVSASGLAVLGFPEVFVGMDSSNLHVSTEGLFGGVYTVSVTDEATNTYDLGTFTVPIFTNHTWTHWPIPLPIAFPNLTNELMVIPIGNGSFSLPDGLSPTNVVGISVADSNAVVDLVGTFNTPTNRFHHEFGEDILLAPTNDAPAGATGRADLDENDRAGTNLAVVTVEAEELRVGTYTVNLTDKTGTNMFVLGDLDVSTWTNWPGFAEPCFRIFGRTNTTGRAQFPLPVGLDPTNVVTISVVDSNAVVELVGDFTNPTNTFHCGFNDLVAVIAGQICTNLHGDAQLQISVTKGKAHNRFSLVAQGAPPSKTFTLLVNGVSVGKVKSSRQGGITLKSLPKGIDLVNVMTVEADDSDGNVVFSANF